MMKRKSKPPEKGAPKWMVTYSDMVTLILVFFILLFSMSQIDMKKFQAIADSFRDRNILEFYPSAIPLEHPTEQSLEKEHSYKDKGKDDVTEETGKEKTEEDSLDKLLYEVNKFITENDLQDIVVTRRMEEGVVLVLPEQIFFDFGEADILNSAIPFLDRISELLAAIPNTVKVEGHTDNVQINSYKFPSNWELASARASSVVRYFLENHSMEPNRFIATGYADTKPVAPNDNNENRQKNRRVEITIIDSEIESQQ